MNALNRTLVVTLLTTAACAVHAQATITHDKALAGSVTPGDAAGYPITISQPGSYKLMSNLTVPAGSDGIVITAPDVSLDLNGFRIIGPGTCSYQYYKASCTAQSGTGITGAGKRGISIKSGSVLGFSTGIELDDGRISDVSLRHNLRGLLANAAPDVYLATTLLISGAHVTLNKIGLSASNIGPYISPVVFIERSVFRMNEAAISGTGQETAVNESTVMDNGVGIQGARYRGTLSIGNGTNTSNATAY